MNYIGTHSFVIRRDLTDPRGSRSSERQPLVLAPAEAAHGGGYLRVGAQPGNLSDLLSEVIRIGSFPAAISRRQSRAGLGGRILRAFHPGADARTREERRLRED